MEKFQLKRRNSTQAGKLALAIHFEDQGFEVEVSNETETLDMRIKNDWVRTIQLWGVSVAFKEIDLYGCAQIGDPIRTFLDQSEENHKSYSHLLYVDVLGKKVKIFGLY